MNWKEELIYNLILGLSIIGLIIILIIAVNIFIFKPSINWFNSLGGLTKFLLVLFIFLNIRYLFKKILDD